MPPIHEYLCADCGEKKDELIRKAEDEPTQCPSCGSAQYTKQVSAHGGYEMNSGPASVRPRGAGSFRRK